MVHVLEAVVCKDLNRFAAQILVGARRVARRGSAEAVPLLRFQDQYGVTALLRRVAFGVDDLHLPVAQGADTRFNGGAVVDEHLPGGRNCW